MTRWTAMAILLLALFAGVTVNAGAPPDNADLPAYTAGDYWKFSYDAKEELGLFGSLVITVIADALGIQQGGVTYTCYELDVAGSGVVYGALEGQAITGNWNLTGKLYLETSDLSEVTSVLTTNATVATSTASILMATTTETMYDPPLKSLNSPFTAGASWSAETNETTITTVTINGATDTETVSTIHTLYYEVVRTEMTAIPAGAFETHLVRYSAPDGSSGEYYFAPDARYSIIEKTYNASGAVSMTSELMEYGRWAGAFVIPPLILVPGVTAAGVVVGWTVFFFYARKTRRATAKPSTSS